MTDPVVFGLELGGTKAIAVRALGSRIVDMMAVPTTTPEVTLGAIDTIFANWARDGRPSALGIASFGPAGVDRSRQDWGHILRTPKPGWSGTMVADRYRQLLGDVPIGFDTDVNAAALAESRWGEAVGTTCNAYITLGTGVGVGVISHGRAIHGHLHPELGHLRARRAPGDGFDGNCPFHGDCIEGLISGPAIAARAGMSGATIGDDHPIWHHVAFDLGQLLASLTLAVSPQHIAIGGGVAIGRPALIESARIVMVAALGGYIDGLEDEANRRVRPTVLGERAGPLGAIALGLAELPIKA